MKLRRLAPIVGIAVAVFALTACTGDYGKQESKSNAAPAAEAPAQAPAGEAPVAQAPAGEAAAPPALAGKDLVLTVTKVDGFTPFVTNAKGRTIYRFDNDSNNPATSTCFDACLKTWEPIIVKSVKLDSTAIQKDAIGTVDRPEGKQVTLNGWPLYYFKTDKKLGETEGHGKGGVWFAIAANGKKAQKLAGGTSGGGAAETATGGYKY
jgi:predicted lipoprotein with Yx(FWY)xxD motif